ncbi:MAG: plasmid partitioning protein RepB C-terminal domain-containing protein [Opitutaceae bacterium]|nr:plasmid partitioning protein RepB C-terminal domain-containing protein [Opitutaceae bacterium]
MTENPQVQLIPIDRIRVVNPRERDQKKFAQIVDSIATLGLKKPITVALGASDQDGAPVYDLVCGQGRLEAFRTLGQAQIPALVRSLTKSDALLASLIENIARRRVRPLDQVRLIQWMKDQGQDFPEIARKTGLSESYVRAILGLLAKGEERVLEAVLHGEIPVSIAVRIAGTSDMESQRLLMEAFETKELNQKSLAAFKRLVDHRRHFGPDHSARPAYAPKRTTAESLVAAYKQETQRQRLLVKKAKLCESRLLSLAAAFRELINDEDFTNLLRAEGMETMPKFLAERARQVA